MTDHKETFRKLVDGLVNGAKAGQSANHRVPDGLPCPPCSRCPSNEGRYFIAAVKEHLCNTCLATATGALTQMMVNESLRRKWKAKADV